MWLGRTRKLRQGEIWEARLVNSLTGHRFKPLDGRRPPLWRPNNVRTLPVPVQNLIGAIWIYSPFAFVYTHLAFLSLCKCATTLWLFWTCHALKVLFYVKLFFSFIFSLGALEVLVLWLPGEWKAKRNSALTARHTSRRNDEGNDKTQLRLLVYCDGLSCAWIEPVFHHGPKMNRSTLNVRKSSLRESFSPYYM